ncbi:uncharacterized protein VTP21DRAFT_5518 [Calcarisporiella thermophila]|uniref:uncharacterized protein n=1 Tax=Calcarisporiella thermophila TaxID=911321 RepID=UPI003743BBC3
MMSIAEPLFPVAHFESLAAKEFSGIAPDAVESLDTQPEVLDLPVAEIMKQQVESVGMEVGEMDGENAFFVADLGEVYRQDRRWKESLPRIEPFYAVKCNPDPMVLRLLAALGNGFDCASKGEIQQVLALGVDPSRIIYANPCKQPSYIRYAAKVGVRKMTFDNAEELHKIARYYPEAELVLRILTDDSKSLCKLGLKFGAPLHTTQSLLETAKQLGLNVIGISFHVGSGCFDANAFGDAVRRARGVFDQAEALGFAMTLLDVGGGFPGANVTQGITFDLVVEVLRGAVDELFPPHIRVIAEPGRFYVASAFVLATSVIARRTTGDEDVRHMYYINDGVYGSFNCTMFDHQVVHPRVLQRDSLFVYDTPLEKELAQEASGCSVWGPTCDSIDCVTPRGQLPLLEVGDWMCYDNMGAYTITAASTFNGFRKSRVVYTCTENMLLQ